MDTRILDLTDKRFGRLVVVGDSGDRSSNGSVCWECICDCGKKHIVSSNDLKSGSTQSCGCYRQELSLPILKAGSNADAIGGTRPSVISSKKRSDNKSGFKGVWFNKRKSNWQAYITLKGERKHLGYFADKQDAINARKEAEEKYFKPILEKYGKTQ